MKKFLKITIIIILLVIAYFVYAKFACIKPYQEIFVISKDLSGVISDSKKCKYTGWQSRYSEPVNKN